MIDQGSRSRFILSWTFSYIVMVFCGLPFSEIVELRKGVIIWVAKNVSGVWNTFAVYQAIDILKW